MPLLATLVFTGIVILLDLFLTKRVHIDQVLVMTSLYVVITSIIHFFIHWRNYAEETYVKVRSTLYE